MNDAFFPLSEKEANERGISNRFSFNESAEFPKRLKELRKAKGDTLAVAAEGMGVTRSTLGLYEKGENVPDVKTIVRIARHYGATVNYLLGEQERPTYELSFIAAETGLSNEAIANISEYQTDYDDGVRYGEILSRFIESNYFFVIFDTVSQAVRYAGTEVFRRNAGNKTDLNEIAKELINNASEVDPDSDFRAFWNGEIVGISRDLRYTLYMSAFKHKVMDLFGEFFDVYTKEGEENGEH